MKPVNAEDNPGLAKLPTEVRNKMGYMKKGGMTKHPMKKGSKRMKKFEDGGYTGDDEMVQYRMGQIKDPGIDLFKLVRGEEQVAKPVPLDKKPQTETAKSEPKVEYKENIVETEADLNPYGVGKGTTTKKQSFGEAFKSARAGGGKTFAYNGKSYTTDLAKPSSSSTTTSSAKPADKPTAKAETKVEPKDDKPVPVKVTKDEKSKTSPKTPGAFAFTDEERAKNRSRLYEGVKSIFSGPADYIEKGSPKMREMRAKDALKSGMASKDRDAMRKGGSVKMASGGKVSSASKRADGCAIRGKTRA